MRPVLALVLFICNMAYGQYRFPQLDEAIQQAARFDQQKEQRITTLKSSLQGTTGVRLFEGYARLYEEYKVFNYDSAYRYAGLQSRVARQLQDPSLVGCSRIKMGFILLSAGLFKEALDSLNIIDPAALPHTCRFDYYTLMARCHYDLADYTGDAYHSPHYNEIGNRYLDSALVNGGANFDKEYYTGLRNIRAGNIEAAKVYFQKLVGSPGLTLHQQALATSTMSDIYIQKGQVDSAIQLLVRAAIADIRSSTHETSALFNLSTLLFKKGDLKNASAYIEKAVKDAVSYGARQRKMQMSAILPLIEGEKVARVEHEKGIVTTYAVIVTVLLLLLVYLTIVVVKQVRKLKRAGEALSLAHAGQQEINRRLTEANTIKEEYIGFFFSANTALFDRMERFKKKADQKPEELPFLVRGLNIKQEREELLKNFDTIFLKIFPHFIEGYNALFNEEDRVVLKDHEMLNTELRIFALIRLGIHDNDKIAGILGYSVNTINTYKTRVRNRSLVSNEMFEDHIMQIKSV